MEADKDRLDAKLRNAVVIDIDAARARRDSSASTAMPLQSAQAGGMWLYVIIAIVVLMLLRR